MFALRLSAAVLSLGAAFSSSIDDAPTIRKNGLRNNKRKRPTTPTAVDGLYAPNVIEPINTLREDGFFQRRLQKRNRERSVIIGGQPAPAERYPYTVSLESLYGQHYCTASLIAPDIVLTAAHCQRIIAKAITGRYDRDDPDDIHEVLSIREEVVHPDFDDYTLDHDVMIVVLDGQSTHPYVTVNADEALPSDGEPLDVMGWGDVDRDARITELSDTLQHTEVLYENNADCKDREGVYETEGGDVTIAFEYSITDNMMCAIDDVGVTSDACNGDSGGPLIIRGSSPFGAHDVLVGIVSWGIGCAHPSFPGVYSRVSVHYDFIRDTVCEHSESPPGDFGCEARPSPTVPTTLPPSSHQKAVDNVAVYSDSFRTPLCGQVGRSCDTGPELIRGRGNMTNGSEDHYNSVDLCQDGDGGSFHTDESIDQVKISTTNGWPFAPNGEVQVDATVWPFSDGAQNVVDYYYAPDRGRGWLFMGSERTSGNGLQVVSKTFTLLSGSEIQALRVNLRWDGGNRNDSNGSVNKCSGGNYDDVDDMVFTITEELEEPL